jgi:hypothetical protein
LGDRVSLDTEIRGALISPKQDYALAARITDAQLVLIRLSGDAPATIAISSVDTAADLLALSPIGSSAAIYNDDAKSIRVIGGLPDSADPISQFDVSDLPVAPREIVLSDDGTIVLVKFTTPEGDIRVKGYDSSGATWQLPLDHPSAAMFFANSHDAVVADDATQTVYVVSDVARTAVQVPLVAAVGNLNVFSALAVSADGRQVFVADSTTGTVLMVDVQTRTSTSFDCGCRLTGFARLKGDATFRLNEPSWEPMNVLDASSVNPRIVLTPSHPFLRRPE